MRGGREKGCFLAGLKLGVLEGLKSDSHPQHRGGGVVKLFFGLKRAFLCDKVTVED